MEWEIDPLKALLLKLDSELGVQNVERLKFVADLPDGVAEQCSKALDVFKELEHLGMISPDNVKCLKKMMDYITRRDLIKPIGNFSEYMLLVKLLTGRLGEFADSVLTIT